MADNIVAAGQKTERFGNLDMVVLRAEHNRTYIFPDGELTLDGITHLAVSERGTHRLRDKDGVFYIVRCGWLGIKLHLQEGWTL